MTISSANWQTLVFLLSTDIDKYLGQVKLTCLIFWKRLMKQIRRKCIQLLLTGTFFTFWHSCHRFAVGCVIWPAYGCCNYFFSHFLPFCSFPNFSVTKKRWFWGNPSGSRSAFACWPALKSRQKWKKLVNFWHLFLISGVKSLKKF